MIGRERRPEARLGTKRTNQYRPPVPRDGSKLSRPPRIGTVIFAVLAAAFIMVVVASCGGRAKQSSPERPEPPEGVKSFQISDRPRHVEEDVAYAQTPPVGGDHSPVWQNCGFYEAPVDDEPAVHSMEHGAVWITYQPDLPHEQVERLRDLAQSQTHVLVSPYPDLPAAVVASAWERQLRLDSASDPRLERFVRAFQLGSQAPESGAPCTDGTGEPT